MSQPIPLQLIRQARSGAPHAADSLMRQLNPQVTRTAGFYARSTGLDRDDLCQEMRLGILLGLQQVDLEIGDPLYYLCLRGRWRVLEFIRRARDERKTQPLDTDPVCSKRTDASAYPRWIVDRLGGSLPPRQQFILDGLLAGARQDEMASVLGCTPANIAYHVRCIRQQYQQIAADA